MGGNRSGGLCLGRRAARGCWDVSGLVPRIECCCYIGLGRGFCRLRREPRLLQEARVFFLARAVLCRARELRTKAVNAGGPIDRNYCSSLKQPCILCASTGLQMRGLDRPDGQREMMAARLVGPNKVRSLDVSR